MKQLYTLLMLLGLVCFAADLSAQQFVFATLDGSPINTTGWNLNGNPLPVPVNYDGINGNDELRLCPAVDSRNGSCFYGTPLDLSKCISWTAEFDYRIWGGNGADGIAFCFLANPPTGPIGGGGVGIPSNPQGLMVVLDQYNNCGGANPELQIRYGSGVGNYTECPNPAQPTVNSLGILRQPNYNRMRIEYNAGNIEVFINGTSYLTGYYQTNYVGYLGFTSSTGGSNDDHSIKNVIIYTSLPNAVAYAGNDLTMCSGETVQLGSAPEPNVQYSWTPTTGLSDPNIANPTLTLNNSSSTPLVTTYTVSAVNPNGTACSNSDQVTVTVGNTAADAGADVAICIGESTQLNGSGGDRYQWTPAASLDNPQIANPVATPTVTTDYVLEALQVLGNKVANGDFSAGNSGFSSNYGYSPGNLVPEGVYAITPNANNQHSGFSSAPDHTGGGNLMAVNGSGSPGRNVWCQTVSVDPNTDYEFSTWVNSLAAGSPARLQFSINGAPLGGVFTAPNSVGNWIQFFQVWNSGAATSATICIVNQNTSAGGNDFGLDDITFSEVCRGLDTVTVTVNPLPLADAGLDDDICIGDTKRLTATGGTQYSWSPSTALNSTSIATPDANPTATITYTVTVTDANSCSTTDDITITVNPLPSPQFNGLDNSYCADAPGAALTGQPTGGTFAGPGINGNTFVPNSAGEGAHVISYSYTDANGCTDSTLQGVRVDPLPELEIIGLDDEYCLNDPITNVTTNPLGGTLTGTGITNPNNFDPSGSGGAGQYMVTYSYMDANGCDDTITQQVTIHSFPASSITPVDAVCYGYTDGQATVTPGSGTGPYQYEWNSVPRQFGDTATGLAAGNYTVTITDANGCTFEQTTTVGEPIELEVEITAEADSLFLGQDTAIFLSHNADTVKQYIWEPAEFLDCTDCPSPQARPIGPALSEHEFEVTIVDQDGCMATNTVVLTIKLPKIYFTPNAFSPNGDEVNDYFEVHTEGVKEFNLQIFDRWGGMVYQSQDPEFKWDGSFKGKVLDPGLYIYRLSIIYLDNIYIKDAGSVTLLR